MDVVKNAKVDGEITSGTAKSHRAATQNAETRSATNTPGARELDFSTVHTFPGSAPGGSPERARDTRAFTLVRLAADAWAGRLRKGTLSVSHVYVTAACRSDSSPSIRRSISSRAEPRALLRSVDVVHLIQVRSIYLQARGDPAATTAFPVSRSRSRVRGCRRANRRPPVNGTPEAAFERVRKGVARCVLESTSVERQRATVAVRSVARYGRRL